MSFLDEMRISTEKRNASKKLVKPNFSLTKRENVFVLDRVLSEGKAPHIIAETKKKSPSLGALNEGADVAQIANGYAKAGAVAISVLTEPGSFGGSISDFENVRKSNSELVLLQKDFVIDPYQIFEAAAIGADSILLIVALLGKEQTRHFSMIARELGLSVLVEVHTLVELNIALEIKAPLIGINNRDLHTLQINLDVSRQLIKSVPDDVRIISESGIRSAEEIKELTALGFDGFLIGSSFMGTNDPALGLKKMIEAAQA